MKQVHFVKGLQYVMYCLVTTIAKNNQMSGELKRKVIYTDEVEDDG